MASPRGNMADVRANLNSKVKISLDRIVKVCSALQVGAPVKTASAFAGVSEKTIYNWISKAGDVMAQAEQAGPDVILSPDDQLYMKFAEEFMKATASFELKNLQLISHAAMGGPDGTGTKHWQAAAWLLERRKPQEYGMNRIVTDDPLAEKEIQPEPIPKGQLDPYDPERVARLYHAFQDAGLAVAKTTTGNPAQRVSPSKKE
jgi:hypothetical protein